jgi:transposase-like protein
MLSATRDREAAQRFFRSAHSIVNATPTQVTTDGHDSYPRAIRETLGRQVKLVSAFSPTGESNEITGGLNSDTPEELNSTPVWPLPTPD